MLTGKHSSLPICLDQCCGPDADPDSTYQPDADPDSVFYFLLLSGFSFDADADPDPTFTLKLIRIHILAYK
jgi:hypothetical protein